MDKVRHKKGQPVTPQSDVAAAEFNQWTVFVRYGADRHSKGAARSDLEWSHPDASERGGGE